MARAIDPKLIKAEAFFTPKRAKGGDWAETTAEQRAADKTMRPNKQKRSWADSRSVRRSNWF